MVKAYNFPHCGTSVPVLGIPCSQLNAETRGVTGALFTLEVEYAWALGEGRRLIGSPSNELLRPLIYCSAGQGWL